MNLLYPFGKIFQGITTLRNALYDRGWLKSHDIGVRTISIGNLTAGGTGKTPVVAYIAATLAEAGESVCILTRGYGRANPRDLILVSDARTVLADPENAGDEPVELAQRLIGKASVIADANRVRAAKWANERYSPSVFVLDDGFQHRRVKRDLDIVCIDATQPWGDGLIPAGKQRESNWGLKRADAVLLTRSDQVESTENLAKEIRTYNDSIPIFRVVNKIRSVTPLVDFFTGLAAETSNISTDLPIYAFCALGNPPNFKRQIELQGFKVSGFKAFRDHYKYSQQDIGGIENRALVSGAKVLFTTAKDAVKLRGLELTMPVYVVEIEIEVSDRKAFDELVCRGRNTLQSDR